MFRKLEFLLTILEYRDVYTRGHTERGIFYALSIGKGLGLYERELELLRIGSILHDVGKIAIPDIILLKPGKLTKEEFEIMKLHVQLGYDMVKSLDLPSEALEVLLYHQEKYDGSGYPFGLKGEEIPFLARIYTVADAFEAMTARRIYKKAKSWDEALEELEELAGIQFDPDIVNYAVRALRDLKHVEINHPRVNQEIEKIRWSFQYIDATGAIKGDLFLPTLKAFMDQRESFCLTVFDIRNLTQINLERGWEVGNEILKHLVRTIGAQCYTSYDIKDMILKLMKEDVIDITSPVVFRIGGDEFAVIAPYIPPEEKILGVIKAMKDINVDVDFIKLEYPSSISTYQEAITKIFTFTKGKFINGSYNLFS